MTTLQEPALTFVVATNDRQVLEQNFLRSPDLATTRHETILIENPETIGAAYNQGLDIAKTEIVVFVHQDVYLPKGWTRRLFGAVQTVNATFSNWAVAGPIGVDPNGRIIGSAWSTGLAKMVGDRVRSPAPVVALDELLIVVKRSTGVRFDPSLPGFHFYGLDIVRTAIQKGYSAVVIDIPVIHNSRPVKSLFGNFFKCFLYIRRKYWNELPATSTVTVVTKSGSKYALSSLKVVKRRLVDWFRGPKLRNQANTDPATLATALGLEPLGDETTIDFE